MIARRTRRVSGADTGGLYQTYERRRRGRRTRGAENPVNIVQNALVRNARIRSVP